MMRLTNLADYAVVVMTEAARCDGCASATRIAGKTGLPMPTAAKLLNALARAGLLVSTRGAGGGFRLSRCSTMITLADIVEAVDGPIALTGCVAKGHDHCAINADCTARDHWPSVNSAVRGALAAITLGQLAGRREAL